MTRWLRLGLLAQLAFFGVWAGQLLGSHRDAAAVWLATEPVDPRDLLSGHYVALRFVIASASGVGCAPAAPGSASESVWVRVAPTGAPIATEEGPVVVADPVACQTVPPGPATGGTWIRGVREDGDRIRYGIERMYVGEANPLRTATSGSVVAKVVVNADGEPRLVGLVRRITSTDVPAPEETPASS